MNAYVVPSLTRDHVQHVLRIMNCVFTSRALFPIQHPPAPRYWHRDESGSQTLWFGGRPLRLSVVGTYQIALSSWAVRDGEGGASFMVTTIEPAHSVKIFDMCEVAGMYTCFPTNSLVLTFNHILQLKPD